MSKIYTSADQLIGHTPLLELTHIEAAEGLEAKLLAKLEYFNPAGSVKDRIAKAMLDDAEAAGKLNKDTTIIEPTSGNKAVGDLLGQLVSLGDSALHALGAFSQNQLGTVSLHQLAALHAHGFGHDNDDLIAAGSCHAGQADAGVGTGGTVTGVGTYLKEQNPNVKVVAVEPASSPVLSQGKSGAHKIQGIGAGFVPDVLNTKIYDEVIPVENDDAFATGKKVGHSEGVLVGISSGAAVWAGIQLAKRPENKGKTIVVLLPDTGDRYLSTPLFAD